MSQLDDKTFLRAAYKYAEAYSHDRSTQNGAVIVSPDGTVLACGANRFPDGVAKTAERLERPAKYSFIEHAERYAILRCGVTIGGAIMYCPWAPCTDCARAIILAGISELVGHQEIHDKTPERWRESIATANQMLDEAGVKRRMIAGTIGGVRVLFDGQWWEP